MTDDLLKPPLEPLPEGGRIFGDTSDLAQYKRNLRHTRALVSVGKLVEGLPIWGEELDEECKPLFEVLVPEEAPPPDPGAALRKIREDAHKEGYAAGLQKAQEAVDAIVDSYQASILTLEKERLRMLEEAELDVVNLALLIAREAVRNDAESRRNFTESMTVHCLGQLRGADVITLRVNPDDLVAVREKYPNCVSEETQVRLVADPDLALGGIVAECSMGRIDASFDRRITDISQQLLDEKSVIRPATEREFSRSADQAPLVQDPLVLNKLKEEAAPHTHREEVSWESQTLELGVKTTDGESDEGPEARTESHKGKFEEGPDDVE